MDILLPAIILIALAVAGIAVKMFLKPGGSFTKTCASQFDPDTGKARPCTCQSEKEEDCEYAGHGEGESRD